ncbi:hypothetical protein BV25DRAFT_1337591 [Artomyces pyxidatus]|uniref:Uncharacterized protein n=1 Tax=Artomyces pyxidatus TaxID=48021 RepID=A0ACB8SNW8_9AGAM|nr:hypothetical protein BV25DRAFT_1337591 [Artomyces pyxidatus]
MTGNLDWFEQEAQANDARLQEAGAVIMSFTELTGPKTRKDFARKILSTANLAINMLDFVANVHPVAKGVVSMFKTIVQMEIQRSHNDPRIVAIHHMMTQSVCTIRYLTMRKIVKDLERKLKSHLGDLRKIFKEFSEFTSLYYSHRQAIFRILRAEEFKIRLKSFSTKLKESQDALQLLIVADNAKKLASIEGKIDDLSSNVAKLVETLGRDGVNEKKAAQLVRDLGGPREVLKEASKLDRVAEILHQPLNDDIQVALQKSLRELQESNKEQFKKLFAKMDSSLTNKRILQQLKKGGQWGKLISDDDISHLWSKLEWKSSVEVRLLLEELRRHFEIKFFDYHTKEEQVHQDHWTLSILCKVVHHSMISDVIDEDSSGFISVEETNRFLSREPSHWRMPQRLCFWARGWAETNDEYRELIQERLEDIRIDAKKMDKSNHSLRGFLDLIPPLVTALTVDTEDGERSTHSDDTDDDRDPVPELSILKYEYQRSQESRIKEILSSVPVDSRSSLLEVIGQPRIELSLMPLIYVWLEKLRDVVKQSRTHRVDRNHLKNFLFKPLMVILEVFTARMRELTRLWRQQHMSEALQIRCFCGGIFAPCS